MLKKCKTLLLTLVICALPAAVGAQISVNNSQLSELIGENIADQAGYSVSSAGDVNADGYDDILVGAYGYDGYTGATYLIYGSATPLTGIDLSLADAKFTGENRQDYAYKCASSSGDANGDGYDDILIGASGYDSTGNRIGITYLIYGSATLAGAKSLASADIKFIGELDNDQAGVSVSFAGDVNADGYDDILVGAPFNDTIANGSGAAYLVYGSSTLSGIVNLSNADAKFTGENISDSAGISVASAGDVNADGYDDILVGANLNLGTGAAYLVYGSATLSGIVNLSNANAKFTGENATDNAGIAVASAGDVNADGYDDILVGAYLNLGNGAAYLVYGSATLSGIVSLSSADVKFIGENYFDHAGNSISSAGDVNADGYDDILVGAYYYSAEYSGTGAAYLIYGSSTLYRSMSLSSADVKFTGEAASDYSGYSISSAGDVNADGYDDILNSAIWNDAGGSSSGSGYLGYLFFDIDNDGVAGSAGILPGTDCDDTDPAITNYTYYQDSDGDGLGSLNAAQVICTTVAPAGYVTNSNDADDTIKDISTVAGTINGDILITYVNSDTAVVNVFRDITNSLSIIQQFNNDPQRYIVTSAITNRSVLVDVYNRVVLGRYFPR